jgi:mono/diheme cytochrome c family protein
MGYEIKRVAGMLTGAALAASTLMVQSSAWAMDDAAMLQLGKDEFMASCASCHGVDAKGSGPVAAALNPKPSDLTKIAVRYNGNFPGDAIYQFVDGQKMIGPHGDRAMPVWGYRYLADALERAHEVPHDVDPNALVHDRIAGLVKYLESIQVK